MAGRGRAGRCRKRSTAVKRWVHVRAAGQCHKHTGGSVRSAHNGNSPAGPYTLTICGIPLNPVPPRWQDLVLDFGP